MDRQDFIATWTRATKILSKRDISAEYIEFNTEKMQIFNWDANIIKQMFDEICSGDPKIADITADSIKKGYWSRYKIKHGVIDDNEPKPCAQKLCNGKGMIKTLKKVKGYEYELDYVWRCPCVLGINLHASIPVYRVEEASKLGHRYIAEEGFQPYTYEIHQMYKREQERQDQEKTGRQMEFNDEINKMVKAKGV